MKTKLATFALVILGFHLLPAAALAQTPTTSPTPTPPAVRIGDELELTFPSMEGLQRLQQPKDKTSPAVALALHLDGRPMALSPAVVDWHRNRVLFQLARTPANDAQWRALFQALAHRPSSEVDVAIGVENAPERIEIPRIATVRLMRFADWWWWPVAVILMLGLLAVLIYLGVTEDLLRDTPVVPLKDGEKAPFSLGRVQMALWFWVVTSAYLGLWLVMGDRDSLNSTALTLLGISVATGVAARTIDAGKNTTVSTQRAAWIARIETLDKMDAAALTPELTLELATLKTQCDQLDAANREVGKNFFLDLICDENGVSLHRLQMVVWTLVLVAVFIVEAFQRLAMPEFDSTLLALTGISAGAYLGFKVPEQPATK